MYILQNEFHRNTWTYVLKYIFLCCFYYLLETDCWQHHRYKTFWHFIRKRSNNVMYIYIYIYMCIYIYICKICSFRSEWMWDILDCADISCLMIRKDTAFATFIFTTIWRIWYSKILLNAMYSVQCVLKRYVNWLVYRCLKSLLPLH
jgi:hypothetical protein